MLKSPYLSQKEQMEIVDYYEHLTHAFSQYRAFLASARKYFDSARAAGRNLDDCVFEEIDYAKISYQDLEKCERMVFHQISPFSAEVLHGEIGPMREPVFRKKIVWYLRVLNSLKACYETPSRSLSAWLIKKAETPSCAKICVN